MGENKFNFLYLVALIQICAPCFSDDVNFENRNSIVRDGPSDLTDLRDRNDNPAYVGPLVKSGGYTGPKVDLNLALFSRKYGKEVGGTIDPSKSVSQQTYTWGPASPIFPPESGRRNWELKPLRLGENWGTRGLSVGASYLNSIQDAAPAFIKSRFFGDEKKWIREQFSTAAKLGDSRLVDYARLGDYFSARKDVQAAFATEILDKKEKLLGYVVHTLSFQRDSKTAKHEVSGSYPISQRLTVEEGQSFYRRLRPDSTGCPFKKVASE